MDKQASQSRPHSASVDQLARETLSDEICDSLERIELEKWREWIGSRNFFKVLYNDEKVGIELKVSLPASRKAAGTILLIVSLIYVFGSKSPQDLQIFADALKLIFR